LGVTVKLRLGENTHSDSSRARRTSADIIGVEKAADARERTRKMDEYTAIDIAARDQLNFKLF